MSSYINLKMAVQKTLLKQYRHPITPKTSFCDKTIGSRELIFGTIPIKKCMNILEFFQPNLRWSSGEMFLNLDVWHGMTQLCCNLAMGEHSSKGQACIFG